MKFSREATLILVFIAGLAIGAGWHKIATADENEQERETAREEAYGEAYDEGFADGAASEIDPCGYWTKEHQESVDLFESLARPAGDDDEIDALFKNLHDKALADLAEAKAKFC